MPAAKTVKAAALLALAAVTIEVAAQDVRGWLDRMNAAVEELSYEGTFVHVRAGSAETLHIIHSYEDGRVAEKISSLDRAGREILRQGDDVQCILPDQKIVLLEQPRRTSPLVSALPRSYSEALEEHYEFTSYEKGHVARRDTQKIGIRPKDEYRYGYVLWLDQETGMPLRTQVRDETGQIIEHIVFTDFRILETVSAADLASTVDTEDFKWFTPPKAVIRTDSEVSWRASLLPDGFRFIVAKQTPMAGSEYPVEHLVYSDGLATVSVFIEDPKTEAEVAQGFNQFGSINAYSLTLGGRKVTAMGEVPRPTVQRIATSLGPR
jgi:sigma-E factor negative regulatory protein RseB